jgi:HEAT repeat protein
MNTACRRTSALAVALSVAGCAPIVETPSLEAIEAARAAAPRRQEVVMKPIIQDAPVVVDLPRSAAGSLAQIGPAAIPGLKSALLDANPLVRRQAARALGKMGPEAEPAVSELIAALEDSDPTVREAAVQALGKIGPAAAPAIPALIKALEDSPPVTAEMVPDGET